VVLLLSSTVSRSAVAQKSYEKCQNGLPSEPPYPVVMVVMVTERLRMWKMLRAGVALLVVSYHTRSNLGSRTDTGSHVIPMNSGILRWGVTFGVAAGVGFDRPIGQPVQRVLWQKLKAALPGSGGQAQSVSS
jgi:hypothetical protein